MPLALRWPLVFCLQRNAMKALPAPEVLIRQWLQNPHAITVAAFVIAGAILGMAGWLACSGTVVRAATSRSASIYGDRGLVEDEPPIGARELVSDGVLDDEKP